MEDDGVSVICCLFSLHIPDHIIRRFVHILVRCWTEDKIIEGYCAHPADISRQRDEDEQTYSADAEDGSARAPSQKEILQHLIDFLDSS